MLRHDIDVFNIPEAFWCVDKACWIACEAMYKQMVVECKSWLCPNGTSKDYGIERRVSKGTSLSEMAIVLVDSLNWCCEHAVPFGCTLAVFVVSFYVFLQHVLHTRTVQVNWN